MKVLYNSAGQAVKVVQDAHPVPMHLRAEPYNGPRPSPSTQRILDDLSMLQKLQRAARAVGVSLEEVLEDWGGKLKPMPVFKPRFFVGTLTTTGELFLVPAERREEWTIFDKEAEETCEVRPMPAWAKPLEGQLEHLEFEMPVEIFA